MTFVCGLLRRRPPAGPEDVAAMLDAMAGAVETGLFLHRRGRWGDGVGLGVLADACGLGPGDGAGDDPCGWAADGELAVAGDLRLDDTDELASRLSVAPGDPVRGSEAGLLVRAYRAWGEDCVRHLRGDFAFALWDGGRMRLMCARDPLGVRPLYYHDGPVGFAFASRMSAVVAPRWVPRTVDEVWVSDLLCRFLLDRDRTLCEGVRGLEPGHVMVVGPEGTRLRRYWTPEVVRELRLPSDDAYVEAFREALVRAVRRRVGGPAPPLDQVGSELSGGLDSSGITAIAHRLLGRDGRTLHTFAHVRPLGCRDSLVPPDGRSAVDRVIRHAGIEGTSFLTGEGQGILPALDWALRHYDQPPRLTQSFYNDLEYAEARARGVGALLSGFGGNQGVSSGGAGVPEALLWRGNWGRLAREVPSLGWRGLARLLLSVTTRTSDPPVRRVLLGDSTRFEERLRLRAVTDDLAARVDVPTRAQAYLASRNHGEHVARGRAPEGVPARRLQTPDVSRRLEYDYMAVSVRGLSYRYPLLDIDLIELFQSTPPWMKCHRGTGRHLFRRSLEGWVPDDVRRAPARASANPGVALRCRRDHKAMWERLRAVPPDSPVFRYVDVAKLAAPFQGAPAGDRLGYRHTHVLQVLLLEGKMRELGLS